MKPKILELILLTIHSYSSIRGCCLNAPRQAKFLYRLVQLHDPLDSIAFFTGYGQNSAAAVTGTYLRDSSLASYAP